MLNTMNQINIYAHAFTNNKNREREKKRKKRNEKIAHSTKANAKENNTEN